MHTTTTFSCRHAGGLAPEFRQQQSGLAMHILGVVAFVHLLNDDPALLPSIYPMLKAEFSLSFTQVGPDTLTFQCTASLLQPWIGLYPTAVRCRFCCPSAVLYPLAQLMLSIVSTFPTLLIASGLIGVGSRLSTWKPRVARMASGDATALPSRWFLGAATSAPRWGRCWRRPSSWAAARAISLIQLNVHHGGVRRSATGIAATAPASSRRRAATGRTCRATK
jgi:hypothetical protein